MHTEVRISDFEQAYFLGIGGIGMSAIARYLLQIGMPVMGYDKTETPLTEALRAEGAEITFNDAVAALPQRVTSQLHKTLFILTPAIPKNHPQWVWLQEQKATILKRSEVLGSIARNGFSIAVAGTHGKTTTSTLVAHLLHSCNINFTAFLGGISSNFGSNYIRKTDGINLPVGGEIIVLEADEFDRSFHRLNPDLAIITAMDPDHLDIYGTPEAFTQAFADFTKLIRVWGGAEKPLPSTPKPHGAALLLQESLALETPTHVLTYHYGLNENSQSQAQNVRIEDGDFCFNWMLNQQPVAEFRCGLPGHHNVQNALAALGICHGFLGLPIHQLQEGIATFKGAKRRFEYIHKTNKFVVIDDYAHHPEELNAIIGSVKTLYPNKKITGIFQPHLFSRTQDFAVGFAQSLSALDQIYLMDIYPARELPIPGVDSQWLLSLIPNPNKLLVSPETIIATLNQNPAEVLLILGAGDIDRIVQPIQTLYHELEARI
jgi:UDP-N-acetylmuramate--alanine ligase